MSPKKLGKPNFRHFVFRNYYPVRPQTLAARSTVWFPESYFWDTLYYSSLIQFTIKVQCKFCRNIGPNSIFGSGMFYFSIYLKEWPKQSYSFCFQSTQARATTGSGREKWRWFRSVYYFYVSNIFCWKNFLCNSMVSYTTTEASYQFHRGPDDRMENSIANPGSTMVGLLMQAPK